MICGDITNKEIFDKLVEEYKKNNCEFLIATPPCQGMSVANRHSCPTLHDTRNYLICYIIDFIKKTLPNNILIENVPGVIRQILKINDIEITIPDLLKKELEPLGYIINIQIKNSMYYNTCQTRQRALFLISRIKKWEFPEENKKLITLKDIIWGLPSLNKQGERTSDLHFFYSPTLKKDKTKQETNDRYWENIINILKQTPTGKKVQDIWREKNFVLYRQNNNKVNLDLLQNGLTRNSWDKPTHTLTQRSSDIMSAPYSVHPGRLLPDGTYSDPRPFSLLELFRITGLPDDWNFPKDAPERLIRAVIGESFPPKFACAMLTTMPR